MLNGSIVHIWGTGSNSQVLDSTFEGHGVISSGIMARQVEGVVIRRVVARDFLDSGVMVDPDMPSYTPAMPPVLEDVDCGERHLADRRAPRTAPPRPASGSA